MIYNTRLNISKVRSRLYANACVEHFCEGIDYYWGEKGGFYTNLTKIVGGGSPYPNFVARIF